MALAIPALNACKIWTKNAANKPSVNPLSPHDALKHHFTTLKNTLNFPKTKGFRTKISMKLEYQYMAIFCNF